MTTIISGTTGVNNIASGSVQQVDLAPNVVGNGPAFQIGTNTIASVPTGLGAMVTFTWIIIFDTAGCCSGNRFTPTVAGYYQINAQVSYTSNGVTASVVGCYLMKNGSAIITGVQSTTVNGGYPAPNCSTLVYMNGTTDYITLGTMHNAAGPAVNVVGHMSGFLARNA